MNKILVNKVRIFNVSIVLTLFFSIFAMFAVKYKVDQLNKTLVTTTKQIENYRDQIRLLEIEWVYLNRPERLRRLANEYLKGTSYITISQIKKDLPSSFLANYQKANIREFASR